MNYIRYIALFLLVLTSFNRSALSQCYTTNTAFRFGENISYSVFYNWQFIWLSAGDVYFKVDRTENNGQKLYHFNSFGQTHKEYDWFFKVRDSFESYVDSTEFKTLRFFRNSSEGGYDVKNKYFFDYNDKQIQTITQNSNKPLTLDTLKLPDCTYDVLTTIYYARNINYNLYQVGDKIPLSIIIDNEIFELYIKYLGKTDITLRTGDSYRCIIFKPLLVEGTIFSGGEDMTVWVTDDENKIPVMVEAKILIGSIKAVVSEMQGIRHPINSKLVTE